MIRFISKHRHQPPVLNMVITLSFDHQPICWLEQTDRDDDDDGDDDDDDDDDAAGDDRDVIYYRTDINHRVLSISGSRHYLNKIMTYNIYFMILEWYCFEWLTLKGDRARARVCDRFFLYWMILNWIESFCVNFFGLFVGCTESAGNNTKIRSSLYNTLWVHFAF